MKYKKVCILGLGYIGLPTASLLANNGFKVIGVDKDERLLNIVNGGGAHIEEPGLKTLVHAAVNSGSLQARSKPEAADVFFIAVPTPVRERESRVEVDLAYVEEASRAIAPCLKKDNLVILESTSPPGTTREVVAPILEESGLKAGVDFYLAHCPERVLPGNTLRELIQNNRVIGGINMFSAGEAKKFYSIFVEGEISITDATTAEMVKLMENTYRDVNIALANELSIICDRAGVNVWAAIDLANLHPRVNLHRPGPGVGGHCIAVDPWFIISAFREEARLMALSRKINDDQPRRVLDMIEKRLRGLPEPRVTVLGLSYKGNIDDTRESPALKVISGLEEQGIICKIYDPHVSKAGCGTVSLQEAFSGSDCAVLITDHDEFRYLCPGELAELMRTRQVLDTRSCLDRKLWENGGFKFFTLGGGDRS